MTGRTCRGQPLSVTRTPGRRGTILVFVLAVLALVAFMFAAMTRQVLLDHREVVLAQGRLQAVWLARAGLELAAARLESDPAWGGETWIVLGSELAGKSGRVSCRIETTADRPSNRRIKVTAEFGGAPGPDGQSPSEHSQTIRRGSRVTLKRSMAAPRAASGDEP